MAKPPTDPRPKPNLPPPAPAWRAVKSYGLPAIVPPPPVRFDQVIERRRSIRAMTRPRLRAIVNTIAFATNVREVKVEDSLDRSRRPSPSGGALHPIDVLLLWPGRRARVFRYDPFGHRLLKLAISEPRALTDFLEATARLLPAAHGVILVLTGDVDQVAAAYEQPESLVWRDAGALIQTLHLTATAYGQAFCPLGLLGAPAIKAVRLNRRVTAVGTAVIGAATAN